MDGMHVYMHVSMYICMYVCVYVCMYVCMYICMNVCMTLYCIVLYLYLYIALLQVHTNQKRFQCGRPREKRVMTYFKVGDSVFRVAVPHAWNSLPATIQETKTLAAFEKLLKVHFLRNPEHYVN